MMKLADNIKSRDIVYTLTPTKLTLGIKGQPPVIDGELWVSLWLPAKVLYLRNRAFANILKNNVINRASTTCMQENPLRDLLRDCGTQNCWERNENMPRAMSALWALDGVGINCWLCDD
jgi:hypothetical protein